MVNPDCDVCDGIGFIVLWDFDGPGLHDEDNCPCIDGECDCASCVELRDSEEEDERG